jgi:hypothetical protein
MITADSSLVYSTLKLSIVLFQEETRLLDQTQIVLEIETRPDMQP